MIVTCNTERWAYLGTMLRRSLDDEQAQPCGRTYDDADHSTICPHEPLGGAGLVCRNTDLYRSVCPCATCKPLVAP